MGCEEKINILLVDDRPENLLAIEAIIEKDEYNLVKASSGEEALKYLFNDKFALILLDVQMPGMDGFTTAKFIKAREKTKNIPILFITANSMESEHIFMGYSVGAIDYILKPVDPLILKTKVEGFVDIYKMECKLVQQADLLTAKTLKLEKANKELSETTAKLRLSEALSNVISETSKDSMIVLDKDGVILSVNPSCENELQYPDKELIGKNIRILFTNTESKLYLKNIFRTALNYGSIQGYEGHKELYITRKDGTSFLAEIQFGWKFIQEETIIACTIRDITEQKNNEALIKHMAYHDFLTDLPNRRSFNETLIDHLKKAREANQPVAIMFLNMDRFKYINDSLGHTIGDLILQETSDRLRRTVSDQDFLARVGGDEFNIILPKTNRENALEVADRILDVLQKPFLLDEYELYISTSIGLSIFPYDGEYFNELVKNAGVALNQAKEHGKNKYHVFHTGMNMQSYRSFLMQNDLWKAIERDELELVHQPRVDVVTGKVECAEALLRWNHPSWGAVSPAEFIPLAEQTGQIVEIGDWVFRTACQQLKHWEENGYNSIRLSINFSAQQFMQKDLPSRLKRSIMETNVSANRLEIELTESALVKNEEFIINTLREIKEMGITISIDDFGTGYSSLQYLSRLPINILKIDKSFVHGITDETNENRLITSTIISLAKSLNLSVVAEGVETKEQLEFLSLHHCDEVQGYLFSPPVKQEPFEKMFLQEKDMVFDVKVQHENRIMNQERFENPIPFALEKLKKKHSISTRELEVFDLLLDGLGNKEISQKLFISEHTVKNHVTRIFQKLNVTDRAQAMAMVYQYCVNKSNSVIGI
ncbi:EAL domain-containing protein [Sporosarcina thermotolerans]|uniref:EAL domain-containing protein n=1 Tax=Sporosarcina thermotolerans TaxID=633404 RepID=UPI0024BC45B1|nr:EAL domain-containing protein [Sporosarcina thermotolerans]WHT47370.1 EAL domain-containing protein [Sporosarcina thermotolerans]